MNGDSETKANADAREHILAECIAACASCASAAEHCAMKCLQQPKIEELARIIALGRTCADVCLLSSRLLTQESEFLQEYCALCAEVCHTLREECLKHPAIACCQRCAEVALRCDRVCQKAAV